VTLSLFHSINLSKLTSGQSYGCHCLPIFTEAVHKQFLCSLLVFSFFGIVSYIDDFLNVSVALVFYQVLGIILVGFIVFDGPYTFIADVSGHDV
jgi:hypothetical protein